MHNFHVLNEKNLEIRIFALCKTDLKHTRTQKGKPCKELRKWELHLQRCPDRALSSLPCAHPDPNAPKSVSPSESRAGGCWVLLQSSMQAESVASTELIYKTGP